jgi:hypothetical protein
LPHRFHRVSNAPQRPVPARTPPRASKDPGLWVGMHCRC